MTPSEAAPLKIWRPQSFKDHPMKRPSYPRRAICDNVVDGDTYDCMVEMGITAYEYVRVRLSGVDAPEIFHPKSKAEVDLGLQAKDLATAKLLNKPVVLTFKSDDQVQGRFLCLVQYWDNGMLTDFGTTLTAAKLLKKDVVVTTP